MNRKNSNPNSLDSGFWWA